VTVRLQTSDSLVELSDNCDKHAMYEQELAPASIPDVLEDCIYLFKELMKVGLT
jgi:hypothetical protein